MNEERRIRFSTFFKVLVGDKPFFFIGIIFTCLSIILIAVMLIVPNSSKEAYENYDYKAIEKNGIETTAIVTGIQVEQNTTVNNVHPKIISYTYKLDGQTYIDQFKTLHADDNKPLQVQDAIKIKVYNKQSLIENIAPFSFPFYIFYFIPLSFLLVGIPLFLYGLRAARNKIKLYKYGNIKDAFIVAMHPVVARGKNSHQPYVMVDYYYKGTLGEKFMGKSSTHDMSILTTKRADDKVKIFVLAEDESNSCLVPMKEAEKNGWAV